MPVWLRTGYETGKVLLSRLRRAFARIPVGLRFASLLSLTILVLQVPYLWFSHSQMVRSLEAQHKIALLHQLKSAEMALKQEMKRFQRHAEDYAVWNDAVEAVQKRDTEWLAINIWDWGVSHLGYESVVVWNSEGTRLGFAGTDPEPILQQSITLSQRAKRGIGDVGLIRVGEQFYLVACVPLRDEDVSPKVYGVILFANEVDKGTQLAMWGGYSAMVRLEKLEGSHAHTGSMPHFTGNVGEKMAIGHHLTNPEGQPIAQLLVEIAPSQSSSAQQSLWYAQYGAWVMVAFIALGASLMMVLFVKRNLHPFLIAAGRLAQGDWSARVPYETNDSFGYLAQVFNRMAQNLQNAFEEQERQRLLIQARTLELEEMHRHMEELNEELRMKNAQLEQAAQTDGLTGLFNHGAFQEALRTEIQRAERLRQPLSLIMLDVDHFKQFNDTFGHPAGDEVLRQVAEVLRHQARPYDIVARYGGEEFAIILPSTPLEDALRAAERLRQAIERIPNSHAPITASLGVAEYQRGSMPASLLYNADSALYHAKRSGRNRVCHYHDSAA